jgi:hypothetical protein
MVCQLQKSIYINAIYMWEQTNYKHKKDYPCIISTIPAIGRSSCTIVLEGVAAEIQSAHIEPPSEYKLDT